MRGPWRRCVLFRKWKFYHAKRGGEKNEKNFQRERENIIYKEEEMLFLFSLAQ
jgi:hypothetical protein